MMGPERRFAFGVLLANQRCAWDPCLFRHHLGILVGSSIGMAMTNGYVCGQGGRGAVALACGVGPGLMCFSTQRPGQTCGRGTAPRAASCGI